MSRKKKVSMLIKGSGKLAEIKMFDLRRTLVAASRKLPCYGIRGKYEKGFLLPAMLSTIFDSIITGDSDIKIISRKDDTWETIVRIETEHDAIRRCDIVDLFGVAGRIGLMNGGVFTSEEVEPEYTISAHREAVLLISSSTLDPRTDIGMSSISVYKSARKRPYLDIDKIINIQAVGGNIKEVKMLTEGSVYERITNH